MSDLESYTLIFDLWRSLRELVGTELTLVDYYYDDLTKYQIYDGACDLCRYGLGIETSSGIRYRVYNFNWLKGDTGGIYIERGYLEDVYPLSENRPVRRITASLMAHWMPYVGRKIINANLLFMDEIVFSTAWFSPKVAMSESPRDIQIELEGGESIYFMSGTYFHPGGFVFTEGFDFTVCLGDEVRAGLLNNTPSG